MTNPSPQQPPRDSRGREVFRSVWRVLTHNWGAKILSLVIAVVLWAGLITQDPSLTREKTFTDVTISVSGTDSIKRNGFIVVSDLSETLGGATLKVDVPQMQYQNAQASYYNLRIDLSRISQAGVQDIKVQSTNSSAYGSVAEITPSVVQIEVEEYVTRYRIPVNVNTEGDAPEGYFAGTPSLDPPMVAVSGPKSLVDQIVRAEAVMDLGSLTAREGTVRNAVGFNLLDEQGNPVVSDLLSVTSEGVLMDSVIVEQYLYPKKTLRMSEVGLVTGTVAEGYEIKSVTMTPETVVAAGKSMNIDLLDTLYPSASVDVTGRSASFQEHIKVRRPTELIYLSADSVTVEVEIGPIIQKKGFTDRQIAVVNLDSGLKATLETKTASVILNGPQLWINKLRSRDITLTCDAAGLTEGVYDLPVLCQVEGDDGQTYTVEVTPMSVQVTISEK